MLSALWQRSLVSFARAKIPARQRVPWKGRREKEELGLLRFPCVWQAGECQGSRAGTALCPWEVGKGAAAHMELWCRALLLSTACL